MPDQPSKPPLPRLIQGGMGIGISPWRLAREVSLHGGLGVVAGALLDTVFIRRLQDGDRDGSLRRAVRAFPNHHTAERILSRFFLPGGRAAGVPYRLLPMYGRTVDADREAVAVVAGFVEVYLAKEGHSHPVGINLLTKIAPPNPALLYGAMLAGVDAVIMGAGIPRDVPGVLDSLAEHRPATMRWEVEGALPEDAFVLSFDPARQRTSAAPVRRPSFLAIISSNALAATLARKSSGRVDGFVVEGPTAGGHNAPPRGALRLDDSGEPIYGERDRVDLTELAALGLPFWLAGGHGNPGALAAAIERGAAGIQVGTLFAFCRESGLEPNLRRELLAQIARGRAKVRTDPRASPTGYPFKHLIVAGAPDPLTIRDRICDLGYLRTAFRRPDGTVGFRCPSEPVDRFTDKGGNADDAPGRRCLCNGLLANVGLGQTRPDGEIEAPLVTSGDDLENVRRLHALKPDYSAADVLAFLQGAFTAVEA